MAKTSGPILEASLNELLLSLSKYLISMCLTQKPRHFHFRSFFLYFSENEFCLFQKDCQ